MTRDKVNLDATAIAELFDGHEKWPGYVVDVLIRKHAVNLVQDSLVNRKYAASKEIASTDIFVEKAETELSNRSKLMLKYAKWCFLAFPLNIVFFVTVYLVFRNSVFSIEFDDRRIATQILLRGLIKNSTIIGIFLASQYMIVSLYRAFMHEATTLENRVHSLRLGRLFVYLKYSSAKPNEIAQIRDSISSQNLGEAFG